MIPDEIRHIGSRRDEVMIHQIYKGFQGAKAESKRCIYPATPP